MSSVGDIFGVSADQNLDFSQDPQIDTVIITSHNGLSISSFTGHNIKSIKVFGFNITITDLCIFTSQRNLPMLTHVLIENSKLLNFKQHQFQDCGIGNGDSAPYSKQVAVSCIPFKSNS